MAKKSKGKGSDSGDGFGDLEDSFFASGEDESWWDEGADVGWAEDPPPPTAEEPLPVQPPPVHDLTTQEPEIAAAPEPEAQPEVAPEPEPVVQAEEPIAAAPPEVPEPPTLPPPVVPPAPELIEAMEAAEEVPPPGIDLNGVAPSEELSEQITVASIEDSEGLSEEPAAVQLVEEPAEEAAPPQMNIGEIEDRVSASANQGSMPEKAMDTSVMDEGYDLPTVEAAALPLAAVEEEAAATADQFIDAPDDTMVLRRPMEEDQPQQLATQEYESEEIRVARAEREQRRADHAADHGTDHATAEPRVPRVAMTPTAAPRPALTPYQPSAEESGRWLEAVQALEQEAGCTEDPQIKARLMGEAGLLRLLRLAEADDALPGISAAMEALGDEPALLRARADIAARQGDFSTLANLLARRAALEADGVGAATLQDAALVERNQLQNEEEAIALLQRSLERAPDDWFALRLLRELFHRREDWEALVLTLEQIAQASTGANAARVWCEQGLILESRLRRLDQAAAAYGRALDASPTSSEAFLAVERLARAAGDGATLVDLYKRRAAADEGADSVFWLARAARLGRSGVSSPDEVAVLYGELLSLAGPGARELRHEAEAFLLEQERWEELASAIRAEAEATAAPDSALAWYRLGQLLERKLNDQAGALDAWKHAVEADPASGPAADAVARLLAQQGDFAELLAFLESMVASLDDPNLVVTALYRMGEICEGPLADQDGARTWFERILDTAPGYLPALEGLERVYTRLQSWERLAGIYEQRALLSEDPNGSALQLHRAGAVEEFRLGHHDRARDFYRRALEAVADFPPSLDAYARVLEVDGDWEGLARALRAAADVTRDSNELVSLTYRAARIFADRVGDEAAAVASLRRCLELSPGFLPAISLLRELSAKAEAWRDVYELHRLEADAAEALDRRHWRMLAAAEAASLLEEVNADDVIGEILSEDPGHMGALDAREAGALQNGDLAALIQVYQKKAVATGEEGDRARIAARIADVAGWAGDTVSAVQAVSELVASGGADRPLRSVARVAETLNYWEEAARALEGTEGAAADLARLIETHQDDANAAADAWRKVLEETPEDVEAASGLERSLSAQGASPELAQAHGRLADLLGDSAQATMHALLAGHLFEEVDQAAAARRYYQQAFDAHPAPGRAFRALVGLMAADRDPDGVELLYAALPEPDPQGLAGALEECGAPDRAASIWASELETHSGEDLSVTLPLVIRLEQAQIAAGDWKGAFHTLSTRAGLTRHAGSHDRIEAKRRWILAEKLAETDEAWDFYKQLNAEAPDDVEVLEALARIAGARGEVALAVEYLEGLATRTADPVLAARYQRRIAEIHLKQDNAEGAQQAYIRALDHQPDDAESLEGLKAIARGSSDWAGLVHVLAREAAVLEGEERLDSHREIARIWEAEIGDPSAATDSWRKVLELVPGDQDALSHLLVLSRQDGDWTSFVQHAQALLPKLQGTERSALMGELGAVWMDRLRREDEALRFLDAATQGDRPNVEAAERLARLYAARGNWDLAVDAIVRQARGSEGEVSVALLSRAAQMRLDTLHDREGASRIFAAVLEQDPTNAEALRFQGDHLYNAEDYEGAVEVFTRLEESERRRDLDDFDVRIEVALYFFRFAEALRRLDRSLDALVKYEGALELNPSHLPSLEAVGPLYIHSEQWSRAAEVYRQILQLTGGQGDPERLARTYSSLGIVEHRLGNLDKAKKRFNKALELRPNDIRALQGIAGVLFARGDWNNLLNVYNNIIYHAQEPAEVVDAYLTKGFVLDAKLNLPEKAAQHYEKSLAFNPSQPRALLRLAELALRGQDWPEAAALADRGLGLSAERPEETGGLHMVRAIAYGACGDSGAARMSLDAAIAADVTLADALAGLDGQPDRMHEILRGRLQARL